MPKLPDDVMEFLTELDSYYELLFKDHTIFSDFVREGHDLLTKYKENDAQSTTIN